ncbi:MAG TPA: hypothetical protein VGI73_02530, partial [Solirubrobacterales bacterium]
MSFGYLWAPKDNHGLAPRSRPPPRIGAAGGQRISLGGSLAWATIEAMAEIAAGIRDDGDLSGLRPGSRVAR